MSNGDVYLKAMMSLLARQTFPPDRLMELVGKEKQLDAYNLCDGSRTQSDIAKHLGLDSANFSKTVGRWVELGILIRVPEGSGFRLVHLYPLPKPKKAGG